VLDYNVIYIILFVQNIMVIPHLKKLLSFQTI
jgi:hypothetical protein